MPTFVYVSNSVSGNITIFRLEADGKFEQAGQTATGGTVMPLAISPDRRYLYASIRSLPYSIASYAIDSRTGNLDLLQVTPAVDTMTYIATDNTGRFLLGASYGGNVLAVHPIGRGGMVMAEPVTALRPGRNPHSILADPSNRFVFAPNLGSDQICQYNFDERSGMLTPMQPAIAAADHGSGPRHLCFSPNNRFVYVVTELSGEVLVFAMDPLSGGLVQKQAISILPPGSNLPPGTYTPPTNAKLPDDDPMISAADIHITPNGRFVYASERTTGTIACFAADTVTGTLTFIGSAATEAQPRGFNICPRGKYLAVAGEKTGHVSVSRIDSQTGALHTIARYQTGEGANWVEFVEFL